MAEAGVSSKTQLKCFVCLKNYLSPASEKEVTGEILKESKESPKEVTGDLQVIFLVKRFLEIPEDICYRLLQECGDPSTWVNCCESCSILVSKARNVFSQIQVLETEYKKLQDEVKDTMKMSFQSPVLFGCGYLKPAEEIVRNYVAHGYNDLYTDPITIVKAEIFPEETQSCLEDDPIINGTKENEQGDLQIDLSSHKLTFDNNDFNSSELVIIKTEEIPSTFDIQPEETQPLVPESSDDKKRKKVCKRKKKKSDKPRQSKRKVKGEQNVSLSKKKRHSSSSAETSEGYQCKYCNSKFQLFDSLKLHEKIHQTGNPNKCHICGKRFSRISILNHHLKKHAGETPYPCDKCDKKFVQLWELKSHKKSHTGLGYTCNICQMHFTNSRHMRKHYATLHEGEKLFQCEICCKKFAYAKSLRIHKVIHVEIKSHKCDLCDMAYSKANELKQHIEKNHEEISKMPHLCQHCGKGFATETEKKEHLEIHVEQKHNSCDICGKIFVKPFDLAVHIRIHTGEKPHSCKFCGNTFSQIQGLNSHLKLHKKDKTFTCEICGKCFRHKLTLTTHLASHTGEKPYKCKICEKSFTRNNALTNHVKTHNSPEEMSFICHICGRRFLLQKYLKGHLKVHDKKSQTSPQS